MVCKFALLGAASSLALFGFSAAAIAQHPVSGVVLNENGVPLPGAQVRVRGLGINTATNRQGEFSIASLPAGEAVIEVSYLGLPDSIRGFDVSASERNFITFTLTAGEGVDSIVVTGAILDGQARALNQQRTNDATTNIVSADAIGRFPDANIAEALQRVPGFGIERDQGEGRFVNLRGAPSQFTAVTVNDVSIAAPDGETRAVDLDTIPSDVVSALEISKTLLPNQDADSIAGSVNLVTRSPFDRRGPRINLQGGGSYNEIGSTNDYRVSGVFSNTFGENERFGALFSFSRSRTDRQVDNIESVWTTAMVGGQERFVAEEIVFKDYDTRRTRTAFTGALEYRPDDRSRFSLTGTWSRFRDDEFRNQLIIELDPGDIITATDSTAAFSRSRIEKEIRHRVVQNTIWTLTGAGEHLFDGFELDYSLSFNRSEQVFPQRNQLKFRSSLRPSISYDYADPDQPAISLFNTNEHLDLSAFSFRQLDEREKDNILEEWAGRMNFTVPGALFGRQAEHRFGGAVRLRDVTVDENRFRSRAGAFAPSRTLSQMLSDERSQNFGYNLGNKFDEDAADAFFASVRNPLRADPGNLRVSQSIESDFEAEENIFAGYAMTRVELDRTQIVAGLRVEHTDFSSTAFRFNTDTDTATPQSNDRSYTNVFPNFTVRHEFQDNLIGRFAATRAISRPNYPDVVARVSAGDTPPLTVARGNPDLQPTLANNLDAGLEYYLQPLGLLAVNVFYKDLKDFEFTLRTQGEFEGAPATFVQAENAPDGFIRGVELTWQQSFSSLPGLLANFGVFANYTYTDAQMDIGRTIGGRNVFPLQGHSDHVYNLALFYETERFNARLSFNDRSDYLDAISAEDPRFDVFWEGRSQLDFTAAYEFTERFEVFFEAKNLTDSEGVRYDGVRSRVQERERFGRTLFLGARLNY